MRLLLTSQGLQKEIVPTFLRLLKKPAEDNSVAFITTAAFGTGKDTSWLEVYRKQLRDCGIKEVEDVDLREKTFSELRDLFLTKDIIFVNGGNTFFLLYWVKKSGFDRVLPLLGNKLYVGISAGSYICCPNIELSTRLSTNKNIVGLKDLTSLHLVPFFMKVHFKETERGIIDTAAKKFKKPLVVLNDTQAILVKKNNWRLVGGGEKNFYNGFKEAT